MSAPAAIEVIVMSAVTSETKTSGRVRKVTFLLENEGDHPFAGMVGERLHIVCVRVNDDETLQTSGPVAAVEHGTTKERRKFVDLAPATQITLQADSGAFRRFLREAKHAPHELSADDAIAFVKAICGRRDVQPGTEAGAKWVRLNQEFGLWMKEPVL
jgi:hypothetical protein